MTNRADPDQEAKTVISRLKIKVKTFIIYLLHNKAYKTPYVYMYIECSYQSVFSIMKTRLFKYIENFTTKNWKFSDKNSDIFTYFCSKHRL